MTKPPSWFRMYHEFATDTKVQMLDEADQRRFVMLLCIHAEYPESRVSDADLAWRMRVSEGEWTQTKARLIERDLMTPDNKPTYDGVGGAILRPSPHAWAIIRERIFARDDFTCRYCGVRGVKLQCDHVIPVTRGGDHTDENLVTACEPCNQAKRDKVVSIEDWSAIRRGRGS